METLGDRIRQARRAKKMTQQHVADIFSISRVNVTQWESNTTRPDPAKLATLAEHLGASIDWFLTGKGSQGKPVPRQRLQTSPLHIDPDILYDVILRLNQELVKQKKKMNASERSFAIALGYEEKHRKLNGLPPLRPEEIAMLIKRPDKEDILNDEEDFSL